MCSPREPGVYVRALEPRATRPAIGPRPRARARKYLKPHKSIYGFKIKNQKKYKLDLKHHGFTAFGGLLRCLPRRRRLLRDGLCGRGPSWAAAVAVSTTIAPRSPCGPAQSNSFAQANLRRHRGSRAHASIMATGTACWLR